MNTEKNTLSNLMSRARRGLALAALLVFAATAGATWMASNRAEAGPSSDSSTIPPGAAADLSNLAPSPAQGYKSGNPPLTKNGKVLTGKLNINSADEDQLRMLPGIGPAKARRVLAYRRKHGKFKRVRDLRRVKGFGYKTVKKLSPYLTVEGKTTLRAE